MENTRLVLLHGAGLGAWVWAKMEPFLQLPSVAVDFPNRDSYTADHTRDLDHYSQHIISALSRWPREKFIIVAHSIAGVLACRLSSLLGERMVGFCGLSAVIPNDGGSFLSAFPFGQRAFMWTMMSLGGTRPPDSQIQKSYCNDLNRDECDLVINRYVPESMLLYTQACGHPVPSSVPTLYVKLTKDNSLDNRAQERMIKHLDADRVATLAAGHLAMISEPKKLAEVLNSFFGHSSRSKAKQTMDPVAP